MRVLLLQLYRPGSVAYVSKSGGMSNELNNIICRNSDGVYEGESVGPPYPTPPTTFSPHSHHGHSDRPSCLLSAHACVISSRLGLTDALLLTPPALPASSSGVAIGGDRYPGTRFIDMLLRYQDNPEVKMMVLLGTTQNPSSTPSLPSFTGGHTT